MTKQTKPIEINCDDLDFPPTGSRKPRNDGDYNGWDLEYIDFRENPEGEPASFFSPHVNLKRAIDYFESRVPGLPEVINAHKAKMINDAE